MKIKIKLLNGDEIELMAEPLETIDDVKRKIESVKFFPAQQQKLVYAGKVLSNSKDTLRDLGITNNSVFHMIVALRGG